MDIDEVLALVKAQIRKSGGGSAAVDDITVDVIRYDAAPAEIVMEPYKLYNLRNVECAALSLTMAAPKDSSIMNEYHIIFQSGAQATSLSLPDTVALPAGFEIKANMIYELSIVDNLLLYQSWEVQ